MPGDPGEPVVTTLVCSTLPIAREAAGASCIRHSLRPLFSSGEKFQQNSGVSRRGNLFGCLKIELPTDRANAFTSLVGLVLFG
jgi:hypothetical protein